MSNFIASKNNFASGAESPRRHSRFSLVHLGLLTIVLWWLGDAVALAQTRSVPSHGKIQLDSYNYLLRDVHPASQAQANYLQNRLFLVGLKKAERLERRERLDAYGERQLIKKLQSYDRVAKGLSAGRPTSAASLTSFWALVSVVGDREEVYAALSLDVPPVPHDQFLPTTAFIQIVKPNGELEPPPLLLEGAEGIDASMFQTVWTTLTKNLRANSPLTAREVADFHNSVSVYRKQGKLAITKTSPANGRLQAQRYLASLGALADALYRPQQCAQIRQYVQAGGYYYQGGNMLSLIQHMLQNRVTPAQGSTAQLALAELARPISRVLEQEIALHYERIDSLAAGEGHRPYAPEYRGQADRPHRAMPDTQVTQSAIAESAGS